MLDPAPPLRANQTLVRVVAPHFVAGCIFDATGAGRIVHTAPILHRLRGLNGDDARDYIRKQGWKATVVQERADA